MPPPSWWKEGSVADVGFCPEPGPQPARASGLGSTRREDRHRKQTTHMTALAPRVVETGGPEVTSLRLRFAVVVALVAEIQFYFWQSTPFIHAFCLSGASRLAVHAAGGVSLGAGSVVAPSFVSSRPMLFCVGSLDPWPLGRQKQLVVNSQRGMREALNSHRRGGLLSRPWVAHPGMATREIAGHKNIPPRMRPGGGHGAARRRPSPDWAPLVQYRRCSVVIFCKTVSRETARVAREILPLLMRENTELHSNVAAAAGGFRRHALPGCGAMACGMRPRPSLVFPS